MFGAIGGGLAGLFLLVMAILWFIFPLVVMWQLSNITEHLRHIRVNTNRQ